MKISLVAAILAVVSAAACAPAAENPPPTTVTSADVVEGRRYEASGTLPDGTKGPPAAAKPDQDLKLPSDADLDRAMSFLERAWRRLVEMVQNLQREMESEKGKKQLEKGPDKKS